MIKDLMIHLDGSKEDDVRLDHAAALAAWLTGVRLTGLYTNPLPEYAYVLAAQSGYADMTPIIELEEQLRREGDKIEAALRERLDRIDGVTELRRIEELRSQVPPLAVTEARCADLFLATTPYRDAVAADLDKLVESVMFQSGHGIYLVPPQCPVRSDLRTVLVAWKDSVQATRAVAEALPFLAKATRVSVLCVTNPDDKRGAEQAMDLATHLDRHGVTVEINAVAADNSQVGDLILGEAGKIAADLIVMGAYGHSRFREMTLGGATRDLIARSELPLLMAH